MIMGPKTQALVEYVRANPGRTWSEVTSATGTPTGTITRAVNAGHLITVNARVGNDTVQRTELYDGSQCGKCGRSDHPYADALHDGTMCDMPMADATGYTFDDYLRDIPDSTIKGWLAHVKVMASGEAMDADDPRVNDVPDMPMGADVMPLRQPDPEKIMFHVTQEQLDAAVAILARRRAQRDHDELHTDPDSGAECAPGCPGYVAPDTYTDRDGNRQTMAPVDTVVRAMPDPYDQWEAHLGDMMAESAATVARERALYEERDPNSMYTDALLSREGGERPRYAWVVEGEVHTGPLTFYAAAVEHAYYAGLAVSGLVTMLTVWLGSDAVGTTTYPAETVTTGESSDVEGYPSFQYFRIVVRDQDGKIIDAADYKIDLRA